MATKYEWYIVNDDGAGLIYGSDRWFGQSFTIGTVGADVNFTTYSVKIKALRTGSPGTLDVNIYAVDGAFKPTGPSLASGSTNANDFTDGGIGDWYEILLTGGPLSASTQYCMVYKALSSDASNYVEWRRDSTATAYAGGACQKTVNAGVDWEIETVRDFMFEVWGITVEPLTGTVDIVSTTAGVLKVTKKLTGAVAAATTVSGDLTKTAAVTMTGSAAIECTTSGVLQVTKKFTGTVDIVTTVDGNLISGIGLISDPIAITTSTSGILQVSKKLVGAIAIETTVGGILSVSKKLVGTTVEIVTTMSGILKLLRKISRTSTLYSTASGSLSEAYLVGTIDITTTVSGVLKVTKKFTSTVNIVTTVGGWLYEFERLRGSIGITTTVTGTLSIYVGIKEITGSIAIVTNVTGTLVVRHSEIPPFMDADLIDPFSGGAWLWLVEIAVPAETTRRMARNTADIRYDGKDFDKSNIQIGEQIFTGDGSIPRVTLKVFQDTGRAIEDLINDTEGALGGAVKLIRVNEQFLETPVSALEADYDNLASQSDSEWITFTLGMPNPLTQRFPINIFNSSLCPEATPTLFKGPACQYVGGDGTCTGTYEDCYGKGNAVHWGAELGLNPNVVRV